ncbi:MAG: iron ABC transporter permease [Anaerolineae bacterium]|nr:iron ABC transporter permease [Anaerolineae bacterium]
MTTNFVSRMIESNWLDLPQTGTRPLGRVKHRFSSIQPDQLFTAALYMSAALFAFLVLLVPLYLVVRTGTAWQEAVQTLTRLSTLRVLGNTVLLAASVTIASAFLAVPLAWLTTRSDLPGRKIWSVVHALPLVIPSYIYAFLFVSFLSPKGILQQIVERPFAIDRLPSIYGFTGAFLVLTLISYPFIFLTTQAALRHMDPTLMEVAQTYGASKRQLIRYVLLPYLRPAILAGGLLVALYTLRDFGAVTLLQYSTFTRVIYNRYQSFRLDEAASLALVLILLTGIVLLFESRLRQKDSDTPLDITNSKNGKRFALNRWRWPAFAFSSIVAFFSLVMPMLVLLYWVIRGLRQDWLVQTIGDTQKNTAVFTDLIEPAWMSISTAFAAAVIALIVAIPIALLAVRYSGKAAAFFERLSYASYALPGIVVALAFVYAGINFARPFYQTLPMLIMAFMVLFVPQAVSATRSSLAQIPVELEEAGFSLGGTRLAILWHVTLPLMRPGIMAGGLLVFLTVMKELPVTLLLSPIGFSTLPTLVWANISEAFFARAAAPTLLLLLVSSVPLAWVSIRDNRE